MDWSGAIPTFVISLRESTEAALVVGIVLAYLKKVEQTTLQGSVWQGMAAGLGTSILFGVIAQLTIGSFSGTVYYLTKGICAFIAVVMLTWMLIWMTQQAKVMRQTVHAQVDSALGGNEQSRRAIFGLIFVSVLREGAESVLFIAGSLVPDATQSGMAQFAPGLGCALGILGAVLLSMALFRCGVKLNIRLFFQVLGIFLLLIVAGLIVTALAAFDLANTIDKVFDVTTQSYQLLDPVQKVIPFFNLGSEIFDWSNVLPQDKFPGIVLATLFGYTDKLYALQVLSYGLFLITAGSIYFYCLSGGTLERLLHRYR